MSDQTPTVKESQVDWLTLTFKEGGKWAAARIAAEHLLARELADGEDEQPLRFQGYDGRQAGRCGYGVRDDGALIRLSGAVADEGLPDLLPLATNVSRIDLAVTLALPQNWPNPMKEGFRLGPTIKPTRGAAPDYQLIEHSRQGTTLYVGARTSPRFGRVYDKWRESQLDFYRGCTRYELEAKGKLAARLAAAVAGAADRRSTIRVYVRDYFQPRGVDVPIDEADADLHLSLYRPRTSDLSRLHWLGTQVKGVVDELRARGRGADVDAALGTNAEVVPPVRLPDWWYEQFAEKHKPRVNPVPD
jgi:hypothetical protein